MNNLLSDLPTVKWSINIRQYRAIKNGQSRETGNIGYTRRRKTKQKHNTIYVGHHYAQANYYSVYTLK